MTNAGGTVVERYAYDAYGTPTIMDGSGALLTASAENNRYLYTGREYDELLGLYHYRARMYDSASGRFCSKDPIGYVDGANLYRAYFVGAGMDPLGTICVPFWKCFGLILKAEAHTAACVAAVAGSVAVCVEVCATNPWGCAACITAAGFIIPGVCQGVGASWTDACNAGCIPGC